MKHWCKLPAKHLDNEDLFDLSESAQLCFYRLHHIATRIDADGYLHNDDGIPLTASNIAFRLHSTKPATEANIAELSRAGLITITDTGILLPDFACDSTDLTNAERQKRFRQNKALPAVTDSTDNASNAVIESEINDINAVTVTPVTPLRNTEENRIEQNRTEKEKRVFAQSANQSPEPVRGDYFVKIAEVCKIPRDSKIHARSINAAAVWFVSKSELTPAKLDEFLAWWLKNDWRGQKNEYPKPEQIVSEWLKFESNVTAKTPQSFKAKTFRRPQVESYEAERDSDEQAATEAAAAARARIAARRAQQVPA